MSKLRKILKPIAILYGEVVKVRNTMYDKGVLSSTKFDTPTIVVGNLSVGGTGKSPQIEYLVRLLKEDYKIAILSRGYKRTSKGFHIADANSTVAQIGDEPMQFFKKFKNIIVAVDADRVHGVTQLKKIALPPDVILLDDAYQHRKIQGGFNILLTPHDNLYVDDTMLPAGDLRENVAGAKRADVIIVTKCPNELTDDKQFEITKKLAIDLTQTAYFTKIAYDENVYNSTTKIQLTDLKDYEIILVTGIAKTKPLTEFLTSQKIKFEHLKYSDHYNFSEKDLKDIKKSFSKLKSNKKIILTTEKDYVRTFENDNEVFYLPIKTQFLIPNGMEEKSFKTKIQRYVEQSTRNS
ncbi:MAG: tetraacyldisaccharide 4'-kinase [Flavobacteriaceae bacterium]